MTIPLFHVDAFTERPFAGNPAAVCLVPSWKEDQWLQAVARETNLSETAFLVKQADHIHLRWFTPKVEVDLCDMQRWPQRTSFGSNIRQPAMKSASRPELAYRRPCVTRTTSNSTSR
jgi:hypothetical protein